MTKGFEWWAEVNSRLTHGEFLSRETVKEAVSTWLNNLGDPNYLAPTVGFWAAFTSRCYWKGYDLDELAGVSDGIEATKNFHYRPGTKGVLVDMTGGGTDTYKTFNISTAASMVAAAAGAISPKQGGPALTSKSGSMDVALAMGFNLMAKKEVYESCIEELGFAYPGLFEQFGWIEPMGRMKPLPFASTIFCFLDPFRRGVIGINTFDVKRGVRGISLEDTEMLAKLLDKIGFEWAMVVCGYGPTPDMLMDEFSIIGKTKISELKKGTIKNYEISPEEVGLKIHPPETIAPAETHEENARHLVNSITGKDEAKRDAVALNAAGMLYLGEVVKDLKEGVRKAMEAIKEGKVVKLIEKVLEKTGGDIERFRSYL